MVSELLGEISAVGAEQGALTAKLDQALETTDRALLLSTISTINDFLSSVDLSRLESSLQSLVAHQSYDRCVRPKHRILEHGYKAFSPETYGELLPDFVDKILEDHCCLDAQKVVVDLGCGVGNVIAQISLKTGCEAYGIEIREQTVEVANTLVREVNIRSKIWGFTPGKITVLAGDMLTHPDMRRILACADLIICNNRIFGETLNQAIFELLRSTVKTSATIVSTELLER
ncbi:hypothetical protein MPER_06028, partial [Moniliophthora perniciosa FA553]